MTSLTVRAATSADFAKIAELTVAAYRGDGQTWPGHPYELTLSDVAGRASTGDLLVCTDDQGQILGAVLLAFFGTPYAELSSEGEAEFRMLAVDPAAQRKGAARALVLRCLDRAREHGCKAVVICVRDFAETAKLLYHRLGFVRVPELDWSPMEGVLLQGLRYDF